MLPSVSQKHFGCSSCRGRPHQLGNQTCSRLFLLNQNRNLFFSMIFFCYQKNVYDAFCLYIMIYRANNNNNNALWMLAFIWYCKCLCACVCVREGVHYCVCVGWPVITISFSVYILLLSVKLQYAAYWKHTTPGQSVSERHRRGLFLLLCSSSAEIPINLLYHLIYTFVYLAVHSKYTEL